MNITKFDFTILISSLLIIALSTVMLPAMGMVEDDTMPDLNEDMPDLDIDEAMVDRVGERPRRPVTPDGGELIYDADTSGDLDGPMDDRIWLRRDAGETPPQIRLYFLPEGGAATQNLPMNASIRSFDADGNFLNRDDNTFENETGSGTRVELDDYEVYMEITELNQEAEGTINFTARAEWEITEGPQDSAWYSGIPVLGGLIGAGVEIAATLMWLISIVFWFLAWVVNLAINAIAVFIMAFIYGLDLLGLAVTSQTTLISSAPGFASVLLVAVNAAFGIMLMKFGFIFIKSLPTT